MDFISITLVLVLGLITALLAYRKGYNPYWWFFAANIIGLIILAFLPFTNKQNLTEEEKIKKVKRGNSIGRVLALITIILTILRFIAFLSY